MTRRSLLLRFLALALPLILILCTLHYLDLQTERERWRRQMSSAVEQSVAGLTGGFHEAATDTLALAADAEFRARLLQSDFTFLSSRIEAMARFKPHYRQMRYIDESGMERLRIDTSPAGVVRVGQAALQNKADRDYFREAVGIPDGAVRLSRLDLNIEHGRIETPHNPMLRFSSPVFDASGARRGVIVINMGVAPLLERLEGTALPEAGRLMLINPQGSWLAGGDPALRWGDILANGNGFARERAAAWQRLTQELDDNVAQWQVGDYLYAGRTLHPTDIVRNQLALSHIHVESADAWWAVVSEADMGVVDAGAQARLRTGLALAGVGLIAWFLILQGWRRLKVAAHLANLRIRQLASVVEQTSDIVFITDPQGRIEYVNPAFSDNTGYAREDAVGKTPTILKSGQHSPAFFSTLWNEIRQGKQFRDLFVNRRRDGTLFYEEKTISPLTDESGHITNFVSTGKDITDSKVTRLAFHDQLTGLVNRALFMDRLQHEMAHAVRSSLHMAVLYMDLDGFKAINDTLGHRAGDEVLKEFAYRIGALMRKSDTLARLGGDEFAMLLRDIGNTTAAEQVAGKIVETVQQEWLVDGRPVALGVSIGIVLYPVADVDGESLLARADAAMYDAKRGGRNRYVIHTPPVL